MRGSWLIAAFLICIWPECLAENGQAKSLLDTPLANLDIHITTKKVWLRSCKKMWQGAPEDILTVGDCLQTRRLYLGGNGSTIAAAVRTLGLRIPMSEWELDQLSRTDQLPALSDHSPIDAFEINMRVLMVLLQLGVDTKADLQTLTRVDVKTPTLAEFLRCQQIECIYEDVIERSLELHLPFPGRFSVCRLAARRGVLTCLRRAGVKTIAEFAAWEIPVSQGDLTPTDKALRRTQDRVREAENTCRSFLRRPAR
jgi:hypothetical protein